MNFYDLHNQTLPSLFSPDLPLDFVLAHDSPTPPFLGLVIFFFEGASDFYVLMPASTLGSLYCCAHGYLTLCTRPFISAVSVTSWASPF